MHMSENFQENFIFRSLAHFKMTKFPRLDNFPANKFVTLAKLKIKKSTLMLKMIKFWPQCFSSKKAIFWSSEDDQLCQHVYLMLTTGAPELDLKTIRNFNFVCPKVVKNFECKFKISAVIHKQDRNLNECLNKITLFDSK